MIDQLNDEYLLTCSLIYTVHRYNKLGSTDLYKELSTTHKGKYFTAIKQMGFNYQISTIKKG